MPVTHQEIIPRHPSLSRRDRQKALALASAQAEAMGQEDASRHAAIQRLVDSARAHFVRALGHEGYDGFRLLLQEEALRCHAPLSLESPPHLQRKQRAQLSRRRLGAYLRKAGVDPKQLRSKIGPLRARVRELSALPDDLPRAVRPRHVPAPIRLGKTNPWSLYEPPFAAGQLGSFTSSKGSGGPAIPAFTSFSHQHNLNTGLVGHTTLIAQSSAGDDDHASVRVDTQASVVHTTNRTGLIEAWIEFDVGLDWHRLRQTDEAGYSNSNVWQRVFGMMHVLHPDITGPSLALVSSAHYWGAPDDVITYEDEPWAQGSRFWVHLFSDAPLPAGASVGVRAGVRVTNDMWTNDVSIRSETNVKFSLRKLWLRSAVDDPTLDP